ncbi:MAG: SIMPL domain-containing protein [Sphingobacteriaceae bacterium]|nr:SIMPL domain-containing protein [Sphingobacteriaceae bacterium]
MRRLIVVAFIGAIAVSGCTQNIDTRHKIEVSGSAETEITPDIIYVGISLKEYFQADKSRVTIEKLERKLQSAALKAGIPKENFTINNISSFNYVYERKKNPAFIARKQYRIKVSDLNKFNQIISAVDARAIEYTNIEGYDYSKIESTKQELTIQALKSAKSKASAMAAAVDNQVGDVLEINEINNEIPYPVRTSPAMRDGIGMAVEMQSNSMPQIDFKKTKLIYHVRAVFELK